MIFTENEEIIKPYLDPIFKALFTGDSKESKEALKGLLSAFLKMNITDVSVVQNEPAPVGLQDKAVRFDISCKLDTGELVDVEMSMNSRAEYERPRIEYYLGKLFTSQDVKGMEYDELNSAYQISIFKNGSLFKNKKFVNRFRYLEEEEHFSFGGMTQIITVELDKIDQLVKEDDIDLESLTEEEKWSIFLNYAHMQEKRPLINEIFRESEAINMAGKALSKLSKDEEARMKAIQLEKLENDYDSYIRFTLKRGRKEGIQEGMQRGRKEGIEAGVQKVARKLKESGNLSIIEISEITGLSEEEIGRL